MGYVQINDLEIDKKLLETKVSELRSKVEVRILNRQCWMTFVVSGRPSHNHFHNWCYRWLRSGRRREKLWRTERGRRKLTFWNIKASTLMLSWSRSVARNKSLFVCVQLEVLCILLPGGFTKNELKDGWACRLIHCANYVRQKGAF